MSHFLQNHSSGSALRQGIKAVGIGKKGSRSLTHELSLEILSELQNGEYTPASRAAFFTALFIKGLTEDEKILTEHFPEGTFDHAQNLADRLCEDAPPQIKLICMDLLHQKELSTENTYRLGEFLFSDEKGDGARGLAAIALRVRYETKDEYLSLLKVLHNHVHPNFQHPVPAGHPIIQLAEPFDGVDNNYMITPCLANDLQKQNYRVISMVGRNSGPKWGNNLFDLAKEMKLTFLNNNSELSFPQPAGGFYIDQKQLCPALERWVELRHQIIKRPFLATLEKFIDPCQASIIITSAFHGVYGDKMADIAEGAGFFGSIVVRNGVEGTIAFPLTRPAKILCSVRTQSGQYVREEILFDAAQYLKMEILTEEKLTNPSRSLNAQLIRDYIQNGSTSNLEFDRRVAVTCAGIKMAVDRILGRNIKE